MAAPLPGFLDDVTGDVRGGFISYLALTGLGQRWKMFSTPPETHQYLRVRYYVGARSVPAEGAAEPLWTATELILPAHREDQVRLLQSYRDSFRDKALMTALERFQVALRPRRLRRDMQSSELPDDLAPIARYFSRRFERQALRADERVVRSEVWSGTAPMTPPGSPPDPVSTEARWAVLREYYGGPVQNHFGHPVYPIYRRVEKAADISWVLEYFEP
jgi:hypothetical protein